MGFRILIACPAPRGSRAGNRVTALRWARQLRALGHEVRIGAEADAGDADLLVALHARRSAPAARRFRERFPDRPLVLALTGTDLYRDLGRSRAARQSLEIADRLLLLQPAGRSRLPRAQRHKARVVYQSVAEAVGRYPAGAPPGSGAFRVSVVGHLRPVKDPFRAAMAARGLPRDSAIRVTHVGKALDPRMRSRAEAEQIRNARYRWLGERPHAATLRMLARAHVLVISSRMEGGANVIGEAATLGVPILASRVEGNVGLLGSSHPGLFELGDTRGLRELMLRCEHERPFRNRLARASERIAPLFRPANERAALRDLVRELGAETHPRTRKRASVVHSR